MKNKGKGDVHWTLPGKKKKKPVAYSTKATSDLIAMLAQEHDTIQQVHDSINYDVDAKAVLQKYIDAGYSQEIANKFFK